MEHFMLCWCYCDINHAKITYCLHVVKFTYLINVSVYSNCVNTFHYSHYDISTKVLVQDNDIDSSIEFHCILTSYELIEIIFLSVREI